MREGKAVRMSNTAYEPEAAHLGDKKTLNVKSILCVPMMLKTKTCGALYIDSIEVPYGFRKEDLLLLNSLSGSVAFAIENAQLSSRLKELEHV